MTEEEEEEEGRNKGLRAMQMKREEREGVILTAPCQKGMTDNMAEKRDFVSC